MGLINTFSRLVALRILSFQGLADASGIEGIFGFFLGRGGHHRLEQESGFFFNMKYFEDQVQGGEWEEVERYLSGFTKVDDNRYSMKIFFEIRKQKYLEALDKYVLALFCFMHVVIRKSQYCTWYS
jgi:hypothetical protein